MAMKYIGNRWWRSLENKLEENLETLNIFKYYAEKNDFTHYIFYKMILYLWYTILQNYETKVHKQSWIVPRNPLP